MLGEIGKPLIDVLGIGPDARADQRLIVIGQVHETGEILTERNRIDDGKPHATGRKLGEQPRHHHLKRAKRLGAAFLIRVNQQRRVPRKAQHRGN